EEALPSLLEEAGGLWKQSYPASAYREDAALGSGTGGLNQAENGNDGFLVQCQTPDRNLLSFLREGAAMSWFSQKGKRKKINELWGQSMCLLSFAFSLEDGVSNPTLQAVSGFGGPRFLFWFMTCIRSGSIRDILPTLLHPLLEVGGMNVEKNVIDPEDPRCTRLTLMGQMVTVPPEEVEFAKQAMFSRHPVVRKWPRSYEWFFMKMNIEHIWLQSW
ncbi:CREG2 protein, partial [Oreotrochilus melanogaster]|nr:CREG2 protein [Oreotrochilus melanogaster]